MTRERIQELLEQAGTKVRCSSGDFSKSFKDVGLDSLDVFNFLIEVESDIGREISDEEFQGINTLDQLLEFINTDV